MGRRRRSSGFGQTLQPIILVVVFVVLAAILLLFKDSFGLPTNIDVDFISLIPGLLVFSIGVGVAFKAEGIMKSFGVPIALLAWWYLVDAMYTLNYANDTMLSANTIGEYAMWCLLYGVIGGVIAGFKRWKS